jgi:hypothetical protein
MIQNAVDLGWDKAADYFIPFDPDDEDPQLKSGLKSLVGVWGREKFLASINKQDLLAAMIESALTSLDRWLVKANPVDFMGRLRRKIAMKPLENASGGGVEYYDERYIPDILVIDSLNILNPEGQVKFFQSFIHACKATKLVIFILNTGAHNEDHKLWEYYSDIVLQLGYEYTYEYYVRTIEIVKARFQSQRWGKHQLKIYSNPRKMKKPDDSDIKAIQEYNTTMRRAHPYRPTGGVFIFPSIHSYLSVYKRKHTSDMPSRDDTYPIKLNEIFQLPKGRCTAFIGKRGGHKSHLGYLHILHHLLKHQGESGLIVSLREDEATTRDTLARIAFDEFGCKRSELDQLEKDNHFEILYFPPGYITPEEFFHRMFISVHHLKKQNSPLTVLFNSLDQISARFPLCAKQEIFIPGIIQTLSGEGATSICIAVDEPGQPQHYYNHMVESWQSVLDKDTVLREKMDRLVDVANQNPELKREAVVLQVVRFSGGERAGKRGILELIKQDDLSQFPYSKPGLHFTPLSERWHQGELVQE